VALPLSRLHSYSTLIFGVMKTPETEKKSETPLLDAIEELRVDLVHLTFRVARLMVREVKAILREV